MGASGSPNTAEKQLAVPPHNTVSILNFSTDHLWQGLKVFRCLHVNTPPVWGPVYHQSNGQL